MAQFRATTQGTRGEASRLGSKVSGISGHICGWDSGVRIQGHYNEERKMDEFLIFATGGSNGRASEQLIATVEGDNGRLRVEINRRRA